LSSSWLRLLLLALLLPSMAEAGRLVLSVGHDRGDADQPRLRWSEAEAAEFADLMVQLGGVDPADVTVLAGPDADTLRSAVDDLAQRARLAPGDVEVVVYLSGHARDGALSLGGDGLPLAELRARIEEIPADSVVVVADACTSATVLRRKGVRALGGFTMDKPGAEGVQGRVWIASAGPSEPAYESDRSGGSLFARNLFAALRGAGDTDGDGTVTLSEAYAYLYARTLADALDQAGSPQRAHMETDTSGAGSLTWTTPGRGAARLLLPDDIAGAEVWIVDAERDRAVVELAEAAPGSIALYPGRFLVYVRRGGAARVTSFQVGPGGTHRLSGEGRLASLSPVRTRGGGFLPRRLELSGIVRVRSPLGPGGATVIGGGVSVDGQLTGVLRVGGTFTVAGGRFDAVRSAVDQVEVGGSVGAFLSPAGRIQPLFGGRLELGAVVQKPEPRSATWYSVGATTTTSRAAFVPAVLVEGGVLFRLGDGFVLRAAADAGIAVQPGDDGPGPGFRAGFTLGIGGLP